MRVYYYQSPNFGDALNEVLWPELVPELLAREDDDLLVGIGSILSGLIPAAGRKAVIGTGYALHNSRPKIDETWTIYGVRGPLTASRLGLDPALALSDAGLLAPRLAPGPVAKRYPASFMPHWKSASHWPWEALSEAAGLHYLEPTAPCYQLLDEIAASQLVVTEALHGAIVADAYRVPWIAVRCYSHIHEFKWSDWCRSLDLEYRPHRFSPPFRNAAASDAVRRVLKLIERSRMSEAARRWCTSRIDSVARRPFTERLFERRAARIVDALRSDRLGRYRFQLSSTAKWQSTTARLEEAIASLRRDFA